MPFSQCKVYNNNKIKHTECYKAFGTSLVDWQKTLKYPLFINKCSKNASFFRDYAWNFFIELCIFYCSFIIESTYLKFGTCIKHLQIIAFCSREKSDFRKKSKKKNERKRNFTGAFSNPQISVNLCRKRKKQVSLESEYHRE